MLSKGTNMKPEFKITLSLKMRQDWLRSRQS